MDPERFGSSPIGVLVPVRGTDGRNGDEYEHVAFVPHPLADEPVLDQNAWRAVGAANRALGSLDQAGRQVREPALLRRPTLRREAQSTSALEGTFAPLQAVLEAEGDEHLTGELTEVLNYVHTAEFAFEAIAERRPLSMTLLMELQGRLVRNTPSATRDAGRVRTVQVAIGSRSARITDARFVPPPPGLQLEASVRDLVDWMNESPRVGRDPVVAAAMAHYQFETLHPFNDGNGRIGRLLIVLGFMQAGALSDALLSVSPWFESRRTDYQEGLAELSASGDWSPWVQFFARGIAQSATETLHIVKRLLDLEETHRAILKEAGVKGAAVDIARSIIAKPIITVRDAADSAEKGYQTASNAVQRLVELDILREFRAGSYPKRFYAPDVLEALQPK